MVIQVYFNGNGELVAPNVETALRHVAANVLPRSSGDLSGRIDEAYRPYGNLTAAGMRPSLAYVLRRQVEIIGRENVELVAHALDALPGNDTVRWRYDLAQTPDPSYEIFKAVAAVDDGDDVDEARERLHEAVADAVSRSSMGFPKPGPADVCRKLWTYVRFLAGVNPTPKLQWNDFFTFSGENPYSVADNEPRDLSDLPGRAVESFRSSVDLLGKGHSPRP